MGLLLKILLSLPLLLRTDGLSNVFSQIVHTQCNSIPYSGANSSCYYFYNELLENIYTEKISTFTNDPNYESIKFYKNNLDIACKYNANNYAIDGYDANWYAYENCSFTNNLILLKNIFINYKKDPDSTFSPNCNSYKNKEDIAKIQYLINAEKLQIAEDIGFLRDEDNNDVYIDQEWYETYKLSLQYLEDIKKDLNKFYKLGCFNSNIETLINILRYAYNDSLGLFLLNNDKFEDLDELTSQLYFPCDSNCKKFDPDIWVKNMNNPNISKSWVQYSEQYCTLLTDTLDGFDAQDKLKSCTYSKLYRLNNFDDYLNQFKTDETLIYTINNLQPFINLDISYFKKKEEDWINPLKNAFIEFFEHYCLNNSTCENKLLNIFLEDLFEIRVLYRKLIFKEIGLNEIKY
ncbi:hypothetical protein [Taylorella equigenitalis]|uniref:Uncharacterized protein n=2 Tax=Taylorella equigenitalis TaxID=29575 RepID=A0A654KEY1_TAYEM|nr:hypothetical protein [Taylorella equigenitalis]ADU90973.1 hypothetical protein TEQUI_0014 [Taylorella equigenitalis MCE9]AFN36080.1 hypothetical protein KUI_1011 [Taylorella equigenitalis ATCC 35865]ASY39494.1 hypothetical protein CA604_05075 [Taylorella equigenitalis]ASY40999.1 hypothetical protein CAV20_04830 [Taylorella equigenitalis]WDU55817.1 hypothetical protein KPH58_04895 [Taylorella equigenitalis]